MKQKFPSMTDYRFVNQAEPVLPSFVRRNQPPQKTDGRLVTPIGPRILPGCRADKAMFARQPFVVSGRSDVVPRMVALAPRNNSIPPPPQRRSNQSRSASFNRTESTQDLRFVKIKRRKRKR